MGKKKKKVVLGPKGPTWGGFGWMRANDPERLRKISKEAAAMPENVATRHRWDSQEAAKAARKGALARWKKQKK